MSKFLSLFLLAAMAPAAFASIAEARIAFERENLEPFSRSVLADCTVAKESANYEKSPGKGAYAFVMPYSRDRRLKFVHARFESGKFVSGDLSVLGFKPQPIDAAKFEGLRETFTMIGVRTDTDDVNPEAVLYPSRRQKTSMTVKDDLNLSFNAAYFRLGLLGGSISRIGTSTAKFAYEVLLTGTDGFSVVLGVSTLKESIPPKVVMQKVRAALEQRDPSRKGMVSDRDVIDFRHGGTISVKAVPAS